MKTITIPRQQAQQFAEQVNAFIAWLDDLYSKPMEAIARGKRLADLRNALDLEKDRFVRFTLDGHLSKNGRVKFHGPGGCKRCRRPPKGNHERNPHGR